MQGPSAVVCHWGNVMSEKPIEGRMTAAAEGDMVVFLIGMRINRFRALRSWLPVTAAMPGC